MKTKTVPKIMKKLVIHKHFRITLFHLDIVTLMLENSR